MENKEKDPLDEIFVKSHKLTKLKEGENLKDEIRLLRNYTQRKLKELGETLNNLTQYARDDLKRIDGLTEKVDKCDCFRCRDLAESKPKGDKLID